jgi:fructose-bisphosphate aldolase class II
VPQLPASRGCPPRPRRRRRRPLGLRVPPRHSRPGGTPPSSSAASRRFSSELEIGVVGGEEDGITGAIDERLYSTAEDALRVADVLGLGERGRFLLAATFGNVYGVYQPDHVVLRPRVLREIQDAVGRLHGRDHPFDLVFHGGSGSSLDDIREAIGYGVVKMNVDTDAQYAFTRPIADHMFTRYDGVLRLEGGTGDKAAYDPRSWGRAAEASMADRVIRACRDLGSAGQPASRATERKDFF